MGLIGILAFIGLLEILPRSGVVDERFLPPFSEMISALWDEAQTAEFWTALGQTVGGWALGLLIAVVAAIVIGILIGATPVVRAATSSTIEFLRPIPSVALIPLVVLVYGTQMKSTLILVIYASFWQMLIQVMYGVQDVDPVAADTARSYRFSFTRRVRSVIWPSALPYVVTGFRLAAAVALVLEITGELVIGTPGLGKLIGVSQSSGAVSTMYALVIVTGGLGVIVNLFARAAERRLLRWHPSVRSQVPA
jgi:ABC-type nitrate/sulfonate/bicarbonate transport system permease component